MEKELLTIDKNWTGRTETLTRIIQLWSKRDLSIMGKIMIVKYFLVSQLIYVMQLIGLPEKVLIGDKDNIIPYSVGFWQHQLQIHITDCNWNLAKKMHERDSIVSASLENSL